jgi:Zn-dependent protease
MTFLLVVAGWIFSLCLHEFSHAAVAYLGGDTTVREKGYLTFNPLRYTDPMLSILMPLLFLVLGGLGLPGGAVYIEHWRLRSRHWDSAVSLAGPLSNAVLAVLLALPFRFGLAGEGGIWPALAFLGLLQVSAVLLNLIPLPPLDGYGILAPYLSLSAKSKMAGVSTWGIWVVFLIMWYVPPANAAFWSAVDSLSSHLGYPLDLAYEGYRGFQFWRVGHT